MQALHPALQSLAQCQTLSDIGGVAIDGMRGAFGSHVGGCFFFDDALRTSHITAFGTRNVEDDALEYQREWVPADLVYKAAFERGAPAHNWQIYREDRLPLLYTQFGRRFDMYHYLVAPLFGSRGDIAGVLSFCRSARLRPFVASDLAMAATFTGFLSATLARVTACDPDASQGVAADTLTAREWQVARLAAAGRNNLEIALQLGLARETVKQTLRRVFRKIDVNGRAQMAAKLASCRLL